MEIKNSFELLEKQIENNITSWYPFEKNIQYTILKNFSKEKVEELERAVNNLKESDKILILLDNKLSIKSVCQNGEKQDNLYNRKEIEDILDKYGLKYRKFYYPLPDCKMTNVIFTDNHLPDKETISRNIVFYKEDDIKKNEENAEFKKILSQDVNLFKIFANSFFIECSKNNFKDNEIEFVSFSNMRKEEYRVKTVIKGDNVYKQAENEKAEKHIQKVKSNIDILNEINLNILDKYDDLAIISSYQKEKDTLDKLIIKRLKDGQVDCAKKLINNFFKELKEKLVITDTDVNVFDKYKIGYEKSDIENLTFVKYGFWDMIFQNVFFIDDKYFFYDQEWLEENLPIEFIIYRAFTYDKELKKFLSEKEIYNNFNINEKNIGLFVKLDNKLQENTRSELSWKLHTDSIDISRAKYIIEKMEHEKEKITQDCIKLLNEKDSRIRFLEENMEQTCNLLRQKEQEVELIKNSTSWKITEPLRKLRSKH